MKSNSLFSCINKVKKVYQNNYIDVDESGTKAFSLSKSISSTWGIVSGKEEIILDRPFVFLIRDKITKQILFTGRINYIK